MAAKARKSASQPPKQAPRAKYDWDAIERDYRTGKFTLRELSAKHGPSHTAIAQRAKRDAWSQDLSEQIRQATNAKLTASLVSSEVDKNVQAVSTTVAAVAELNKQVILGHRADLKATRDVASALLGELSSAALLAQHTDELVAMLAGKDAEPADLARARMLVSKALSVNSRISSVKALAETFTKLQEGERKAFNITEGDLGDKGAGDTLADFLSKISANGSRLPVVPKGSKA